MFHAKSSVDTQLNLRRPRLRHLKSSHLGSLVATALFAASAMVVLTSPGRAQAERTGAELWSIGGCANCHGNLAAGDGDPAYPTGPNLRESGLDRDLFTETVACGRPSTPMPYNLVNAYVEVECYGMGLGAPPEGTARGADFTGEQVDLLIDFLFENVVGQRRITRENCAMFFGGNANSPACRQF